MVQRAAGYPEGVGISPCGSEIFLVMAKGLRGCSGEFLFIEEHAQALDNGEGKQLHRRHHVLYRAKTFLRLPPKLLCSSRSLG